MKGPGELDEILPKQLWMSGVIGAVQHGREMDVVVTLVRYNRTTLREELEGSGVVQRRWPIHDGPLPNPRDLQDVVNRTAADVVTGQRVLVHCASGINRCALVTALVVREVQRCTGREAVKLVEKRAQGPVLQNPTFREYVEGLGLP